MDACHVRLVPLFRRQGVVVNWTRIYIACYIMDGWIRCVENQLTLANGQLLCVQLNSSNNSFLSQPNDTK